MSNSLLLNVVERVELGALLFYMGLKVVDAHIGGEVTADQAHTFELLHLGRKDVRSHLLDQK